MEEIIAEASDALDQAAAEHEMYQALLACNVEGPVWKVVMEETTRYARAALEAWSCSGAIFAKLAENLLMLDASDIERRRLSSDAYLREDIVADTIAAALYKLQKGIREGSGWNPSRGAKLRTYFVRGCLHEFKQVFESHLRWERGHRQEPAVQEDAEPDERGHVGLYDTRLGVDPAVIVSNRDLIRWHLDQLDERDRQIVWAKAAGYKHAEIAHLFQSKTAKAIERRLARLAEAYEWIANLSTRRS
ncbi:hypothetical protein [Nocardia asiatica]|uniref:hypothetical protein n=1 Tax=Nocardia asiatica TaxID=209252 RepID=UPI002458B015|nr:hypothetical protein [Nocardia asiatica]